MTFVIFLSSLFGVMAIGVPIAFALLVSSVALMFYLDSFNTQIIAQNLIKGMDNFPFLAIPFFIFAGELMNTGGMSKRIVNFALSFLGHLRGGLGYVAIIASIIFAGISGSAVADAAALGSILLPMMDNAGYDRKNSAGLVGAGGVIGPIIPPSLPMILFGIVGGLSITRLFVAGVVPGLLMGVGSAIIWGITVRKNKSVVLPRKSFKEMLVATREGIFGLGLPFIIFFGLLGGIFTPTEAAVVAVIYAIIVGVFIYRELKIKDIYHALIASVKMTSMVTFLIAAAMVIAWLIALANIPATLTNILGPISHNKILLMFMVNILIFLLGMVLDLSPMLLILVPVLLPLIKNAGIDPYYFGLIFVLNGTIGLLHPPIGSVFNVVCSVGKISVPDLFKGIWPYLLIYLILLFLLILFPAIVTVPVQWMMGS